MLTAVVTRGPQIEVGFVAAEGGDGPETYEESLDFCEFPFDTQEEFIESIENDGFPCEEGPSPLALEAKELAWGAGAFIVLAVLMRYWLFPAVKKGMDARYAHIRAGHEEADAARTSAQTEVADYESALAEVRAEANARVDSARQTLEAERTERLAEVNAAIAAKREAAAAEATAAREAVSGDIASAVADVTSRTVELSIGRAPDPGLVRRAVDEAMGSAVSS